MAIPFTTNCQKIGPIEVSEDNRHFLVRIHPEDRGRAKKIAGRQWDGERRVWVYSKNIFTYNALVEEFQTDADIFNIRRPKTKRTAGIKSPSEELDSEKFQDRSLEELHLLGAGQGKIHSELNQIRQMQESINDLVSNHSQYFEELSERQEETIITVNALKSSAKDKIKTKKVEILPETLNLNKRKEMLLIEQVLLTIVYETSGKNESLLKWMRKHSPLERPAEFVNTTHELLKEQLEKIVVGETNSEVSFSDLVHKAQRDNLIYSHHHDSTKVFPILRSLNDVRNRFAHARGIFSPYEQWTRSILYLMNLALVWPKIMITESNSK